MQRSSLKPGNGTSEFRMSFLVVGAGVLMVFAGVLLIAMGEADEDRAWSLVERGAQMMTVVVVGYQAARGLPKLGDALSRRSEPPAAP